MKKLKITENYFPAFKYSRQRNVTIDLSLSSNSDFELYGDIMSQT